MNSIYMHAILCVNNTTQVLAHSQPSIYTSYYYFCDTVNIVHVAASLQSGPQ